LALSHQPRSALCCSSLRCAICGGYPAQPRPRQVDNISGTFAATVDLTIGPVLGRRRQQTHHSAAGQFHPRHSALHEPAANAAAYLAPSSWRARETCVGEPCCAP
jgi:hypothetical protein